MALPSEKKSSVAQTKAIGEEEAGRVLLPEPLPKAMGNVLPSP